MTVIAIIRSWAARAAFLLYILTPQAALADVTLTFYSHNFGENFPHTFVQVQGVLANGQTVNEDFGFTAKNLTPKILLGSVKGKIDRPKAKYKANSDPQFAVIVTDETFFHILAHRDAWLSAKKRSYNLNKRNCIHYINDVLGLIGIKTNPQSSYFKKPKSFLREVLSLNPNLVPLSPKTE